jgi:hypothetical protein
MADNILVVAVTVVKTSSSSDWDTGRMVLLRNLIYYGSMVGVCNGTRWVNGMF